MALARPRLRAALPALLTMAALMALLMSAVIFYADLACSGAVIPLSGLGDIMRAIPQLFGRPLLAMATFTLVFIGFSASVAAPFASRAALKFTVWIGILAPIAETLLIMFTYSSPCLETQPLHLAAGLAALFSGLGGCIILLGKVFPDDAA